MPVAPLFIADRSTLMASLGIGESNGAATQKIDDAILDARAGIYGVLGSSVDQLLGYTVTNTPTTADELARYRATALERVWIKIRLMRVMPTFFLLGTGEARQEWNEQSLLRDKQPNELDRELALLEAEKMELLGFLTSTPSSNRVAATVLGATTANTYPGDDFFS